MKFKGMVKGILVTALSASVFLGGCSSSSKGKKVVVGSKDFTENEIVAEIYALALEDQGIPVERKFSIGSSLIHQSIVNDEIDLYPEYTGTGLLTVLKEDPISDPQKVYDEVKKQYEKKYQITWLKSSDVNDGQGLAIRTDVAEKYGIKTISDLQKNASKIRFTHAEEFNTRADCLPALEKAYGPFKWKSDNQNDDSLKYQILEDNKADCTSVATTEGNLTDKQFTLLEDDKHVWPPYYLCPIVRDDVLKEYPDIEKALNKVSKALDTETMTKLNAKVDLDKEEYTDVAKEFYEKNVK